MEIINLTEAIIEYLAISSALLLILGLISFLSIRSFKIKSTARLWVCTLIIILPLAYPLKVLFPESVKIPVPMQLSYLQKNNEISASNEITTNASFLIKNNLQAADENNKSGLELIVNQTSGADQKEWFRETRSGVISNWRLIAISVWGLFFFFFLIRVIKTGFKINKTLRLADPVTDRAILKLLGQCATETELRRTPKLYMVDGISTPMVMGFFRPGIIVPHNLLKPEFFEGLRFSLLHELKHLKQHHNWWLLIESIIGSAYFFHPVFYWAKNKIHEEQENICDRHVIRITDKSVSYADFLLNQIWRHNSGMNPALALPFVSNVSKTAARIHSILENTRSTAFTLFRDRISVFFILLVFPLILMLSITPSVPGPDHSTTLINPSKDNFKGNAIYQSEQADTKKEITDIERSSNGYSNKADTHTEKMAQLSDTVAAINNPAPIIIEDAVFEPVAVSVNQLNDNAYSVEKIDTTPAPEPVPDPSILGAVTGNDILWTRGDPEMVEAPNKPVQQVSMTEKYLGSPVNEISIARIDNIKVLDEYTVLFMMRGGDIYLTRLSEPCPSLLYVSDFNLVSINGKFTKFDRIQAISNNQVVGSAGMLGAFYPFRYEGNKYEAIKLLKKNLLTDLVNAGAFKEFSNTRQG
ncbi:MAG: M56 family metallopeptidase [Deltaproteobacteria bacterium]|nr:M56 family metallopeptidase [Deltaproteobacteria bacterium]